MRLVVIVCTLVLSLATGALAQSDEAAAPDPFAERFAEAEALRRGDGVPADPAAAFALFEELADEGMARAKDRAAYALWRGVGVEQDIGRAEVLYREAIGGGHLKSMINLGRLMMENGDGATARSVLQEAIAADISGADFWLARGDVEGRFGDASDPESGAAILVELSTQGDDKATLILADLLQKGGGPLGSNPERALGMYETLAGSGNATAMYRAGVAFWRGLGTEADLDRAISYFQSSVDAGRSSARINLGRALAEAGRATEAHDTLASAISDRVRGADYWYARGHFEDSFGDATDEAQGLPVLLDLAQSGQVDAALYLVRNARDRRVTFETLQAIVPPLQAASDAGDGDASAALLRLYRERPRLTTDPIQARAALIETGAGRIRADLLVEEKVAFIADTTRGRQRYREIDALLSDAGGAAHERGLLQAYREDDRIYTYILQRELSDRGFFSDAPSGRMTAPTVLAFREFCQASDLDHICTHGPLRIDAVRAMAAVFGSD